MNRFEIITMLRDEYAGPHVTEARVRNLAEMTAHVPTGILYQAAQAYMRSGKYFPRVSEFLAVVEVVQDAGSAEKRTQRDVWRYGRFRAAHQPVDDDQRYEAEVSLGLMRPAAEIAVEMHQAQLQLRRILAQQTAVAGFVAHA